MLKDIIGQQAPLHVLRHAIFSGRVPHAYLFAGPPNIGKTLVALWLAKTLNCERNTVFASPEDVDCCDECDTCRRFERLVHPDLMLVRPEKSVKVDADDAGEESDGEPDSLEIEGSMITTGQVERLVEHSYLRAMQCRRKIYLITNAETMNKEAENRLLKTLEEPPPGT
ncbi:MAG: DNA polymerase III subunit delta', partial [Armatimonadota bacterium]